jgi:hypothetical protein
MLQNGLTVTVLMLALSHACERRSVTMSLSSPPVEQPSVGKAFGKVSSGRRTDRLIVDDAESSPAVSRIKDKKKK